MKSHDNNIKRLKILIIGTLPPPIGGTTVLLQCLVESLKENPEVDLRVLDTGGVRGKGLQGLLHFGQLVCRIFVSIHKVDVVTLHCCSTKTLPILGSIILLFSRLFRRPFIIRMFAGNDYRETLCGVWVWITEFVLHHADFYLAETQLLVAQATDRGLNNVRWFPNHRNFLSTIRDDDSGNTVKLTCRRFVYVGHVRECKGICILAEAAKQLPTGVTVDVYGPWFDDLDRHVCDNSPNIRYKGVLKPEEVVATMRQYDVFIYPTHHEGEGYPGAVLEAYNAGLPVITTRWRALPEIVDDTVGILVEPKSAKDLCRAMMRLVQDSELFQLLRANTHAKAEFFSSERWAKEFVKFCKELSHN
jgi:glycosyltransferase involved in cell wall biosynthesis